MTDLKNKACKLMIESGKAKEFDVIRHSYTNSRLSDEDRRPVSKNICPTLDTRCDCFGVVVRVPLKRGYEAEVSKESPDTEEIDVIGNYSKSGYVQTSIVGKNGVSPTVCENYGQVTAITVYDD